MSDDEKTLGVLIRTSRYASTTRRLVCPMCLGRIGLIGGELMCTASDLCDWTCSSLVDLAVKR